MQGRARFVLAAVFILGVALFASCTAASAPLTPANTPVQPTPTPGFTDTPLPPTSTPIPPTNTAVPATPTEAKPPIAGKTFLGPLGAGEINFTVSDDGLEIQPGWSIKLVAPLACADGSQAGWSELTMTYPNPISIQDMKFEYLIEETNPFSGTMIQLSGQFDTPSSASGSFKADIGKDWMHPCIVGPFTWTAQAP